MTNLETQSAIERHENDLINARINGDTQQEIRAYFGLATAYRADNKHEIAIRYSLKALEIAKQQGHELKEVQAYLDLAIDYRSGNQNEMAIRYYQGALETAKKIGKRRTLIIDACLGLGEAYRSVNQNHTAIQYYEEGLENAREGTHKLQETDAYLGLGETYKSDNQNEKAIDHFLKALEKAREQQCKLQEADACLGLGEACRSKNENQTAIVYYSKALEIAQQQGYELKEANAYLKLGEVYSSDNQHETAILRYQKAMEIAKAKEHKPQEANAYIGLGKAHRSKDQNQISIKYYKEALKITRDQEYKPQETEACLGLGETYGSDNQSQMGILYYESLEIAKEQGYKPQETDAYLGLEETSRSDNQNRMAIQYYKEALEIATEQGYKQQEMQAYLGLGKACISDNQIQAAIQNYQKALEIAREGGYKPQEANAYLGLGKGCISNNQNQAAIQHYQAALEIAREEGHKLQETYAYIGVGEAYRAHNMDEKAIEYYKNALKIAKVQGYKPQEADVYLRLGEVYRSKNQYETAIEYYRKTLTIATEQKYKLQEVSAYLGLEETYRSNDMRQMAINFHQKALEIARQHKSKKITANATNELSQSVVISNSWKWVERSKIHREKFKKLREYAKEHPEEIQEVNGVRVCCSEEFLIAKGSEGTTVYVGLGMDGVERAVKRLVRGVCSGEAEHEKDVLNELNTMKSPFVVNYWFLEEQNDKNFLFLILDLCEETLEKFVEDRSLTDLKTCAPGIIKQILKGLADLHVDPKPILHRDLKPSNILRNAEGNWLLADFGISRILKAGMSTYKSGEMGTDDWKAVESCFSSSETDDNEVRYKKESDIQVAGIVAFYIVTKGEHPFGAKQERLQNLHDGKPVGLDTLEDPFVKDLLSWMLSHKPNDRPSANEALKHPYLQTAKQQFEMLCKVGNQTEIKTQDGKSDVVRQLNSDPKDWQKQIAPNVLKYLSTDCLKGQTLFYRPSWTDCLRLIRNVKEHWLDHPRPQPKEFFVVGDPQEYFLNIFPDLSVKVHRIIRSCDWKERDDLKEYFM